MNESRRITVCVMAYRTAPLILVAALGGCGILSAALQPTEDNTRLVGQAAAEPFSAAQDSGTSTGDSADATSGGVGDSGEETTTDPAGHSDNAGQNDPATPAADERVSDEPDAPTPLINVPGGQPVDPSLPAPPGTVEPIGSSVFNPLTEPLTDPLLIDDLLSSLVDGMLLDSLGSSTSGGLAHSYTFLELLCLDQDLPASYCRRRFAN